jgi:hypothetical protein
MQALVFARSPGDAENGRAPVTSRRRQQGAIMKTIVSVLIAGWLISGCVAGGNVSHEDSPAATKRDEGPVLCRDGSTPPCNDR